MFPLDKSNNIGDVRQPPAPLLKARDSNAENVAAVVNNPGVIGYISLSFLSAGIKPLSVDGVMGSSHSLRDGIYPVS